MIFFYFFIFLNTLFILRYSNKVAKITGLFDYPNEFKIHSTPTPLIGGLVIFFNLVFCLLFQIFFKIENTNIYFYIYFFIIFIIGFFDDKYNIKSYYRILLVIFITAILFFWDNHFFIEKIYFSILGSEYYFGNYKLFVTIICALIFFIAFNMADGINCLIITFSFLGIFFYNTIIFKNSGGLDMLSITLLVTLIPLFYFNYKNKTFLGNSGTSILSGYFIYLMITKNYFDTVDVFEIISLPMIMGIDMIRLFFIRIYQKKNIFNRDKNHFHHILYLKFGLVKSIAIYLLLSCFPIVFSKFLDIEIIFVFFIPLVLYFILIKLFNKSICKNV